MSKENNALTLAETRMYELTVFSTSFRNSLF